jgi:hypothetical protein
LVKERFAEDDDARPLGSADREGDSERQRPSASSSAAAPETTDAGDGNPHPVANAVIMSAMPVGVVGLILVLCTNSFMAAGFGVIIGVLSALVFAIGLGSRDLGPDGRARRLILGVPALLVLTASVAVGLSTIMGLAVRLIDPADYHGRYGTKVEAHIPDTCRYYRSTRRIDADITCDGALGTQRHRAQWHHRPRLARHPDGQRRPGPSRKRSRHTSLAIRGTASSASAGWRASLSGAPCRSGHCRLR